jgi:hypothetical protein
VVDQAGIVGGPLMSQPPTHDQSVQIVHGILEPALSAKLDARVTADATASQGDKPDPISRASAYPVRGVEACGDAGDVYQLGPVVGDNEDMTLRARHFMYAPDAEALQFSPGDAHACGCE